MATTIKKLRIRRPDDWHIHLRDDEILKKVLPYTSQVFGRAIIMPNLVNPITTIERAKAYRKRIVAAIPAAHKFTPLMTCYLTDDTNVNELILGFQEKENRVFTAAKLYPANATTNSNHGVTDIISLYPLFECMQKLGMPLLIHGEVTDNNIDIYDREARFIQNILIPLRQQFAELKIVLEHITTKEAADYVLASNNFLAATITPQHLMFNRTHMLAGGIRPHLYCLPILKRNIHQQALQQALASGCDRLFLGTDSAPHLRTLKQSPCGCAGIFNAPSALTVYASIFEALNCLNHLEAFCSLNGPRFYNLPINDTFIELIRQPKLQVEKITLGEDALIPFLAGEIINWSISAPGT